MIAEYAANANPTTTPPRKEYGYRNGQLLVTTDAATASAAAPSGLAATPPTSGTSITLNWTAASGATNYRIDRKDAGSSFNLLITTSSTTFTDTTTTAGSAYLYKVCAANGSTCTSAYSNVALGSSVTFPTDPTIYSYSENPSNATSPKAAHITELRTAVNAVRHLAGMADGNYTTSVAPGGYINVDDVRDLRSNLDAALTQLVIDTPPYTTDPTLVGIHENPPTATTIKAAHIRELRTRATSGHGGSGGGGGSSFQIHWLVADQLGTPRMIFDQSGSLTVTAANGSYVSGMTRHDYLPFGEELFAGTGGRTTAQGYVGDNVRQKFTSYQRDNETGLDFAEARYYSSTQGRFTRPDPYNIIFGMNVGRNARERAQVLGSYMFQPQNWNRYTYCLNNPTNLYDPSGLIWVHDNEKDLYIFVKDEDYQKGNEYYDNRDRYRPAADGPDGETFVLGELTGSANTAENQALMSAGISRLRWPYSPS